MRLRSVRLKNIRSYVAANLEFGDGTTLISGDVGSGKTSLLYSVEMALFGTSEIDAAFLVRHGAPYAEVEVTFEDAEHRYEISRRFRRVRRKGKETFDPQTISFAIDGAKTEYSATELRQRVIELLGFADNPNPQAHSDLWRWAVYVPQERMRDILGAKPQDRLETVRKALGVERYRIAAENAQEVAADLRRTAVTLHAEAERLRHHDDDFAEWTQSGDRLRLERSELEGAIARRRVESDAARAAVAAADTEVRRTEVERRELANEMRSLEADKDLRSERARIRSERVASVEGHRLEAATARSEAAELAVRQRGLAESEAELSRLKTELEGLTSEVRKLIRSRADLEGAARREREARQGCDRASSEMEAARTAVDRLEKEGPLHEPPAPTPDPLDVIDPRLETARERERTAIQSATRAETALREFEELLRAGVCPRCGQTVQSREFSQHRAEAEAASRTAAEDQSRASEERATLEATRRARERYDRALDRWREVERERAAARAALQNAEERVAVANATAAEAHRAAVDAQRRVEAGEPVERAEVTVRARVGETEMARSRWASLVEAATLATERARSAETAIRVLENEVARIDDEVRAAESRATAAEMRIQALHLALEGAEDRARILAEAEAELAASAEAVEVDHRALVRLDARLDEAVRRVAEAERGRSDRARRIAEATELEAKAEWTSGPFRLSLLTMEQKLLAHAQAAFERHFARYFSALIEDPALIARTDVAFTPLVAIEGEWTPAEALSGGERTSLALAFRLALAQVVRSLGNLRLETLLLDEPTDGFSPEQVVRMGELLEALALPQVILVSHEDELAGIADRVVRVEKVDGKSVFRTGGARPTPARSEPGPRRSAPAVRG
jgi:DNA repair protein SbcC/Rad50